MIRREVLKLTASIAGCGCTSPLMAAPQQLPPVHDDDIAILRSALALHPGLYRYQSPKEVDRDLVTLDRLWRREISLGRRYLALSRFLATIRSGHSYCNFFNQSKKVAATLFDRPTRLPFHFIWIGDRMVVTSGFDTGLPAGTVIDSINGQESRSLRARLMPYVRADGHNDAKRVSLLEVRGDDAIETFDVFQGLLMPPPDGQHHITATLPDGAKKQVTIPAIGLEARRKQMAPATRSDSDPSWQWEMGKDGIAVLIMPGWAMWNSKWDWKSWLTNRLDTLDSASGLIVDLRDNEGGEDCGDLILARMIDGSFAPPRMEQRLRFRRTPATLDPFLDTWDNSFRTIGANAVDLGGGIYRRADRDASLTIAPSGKRLKCPVRVLTSPANSSATFQFASNVRAIRGGKLVGRPTGGNRRGINGGSFFFVRLPHSGIEFDLPVVGYFPTVAQPDAGLIPDIRAEPTVASIAAGTDPAMISAVASISAT